jgi:hypothetical protein
MTSTLSGLYLPLQPGYNKRLRKSPATMTCVISALARDTRLGTDDVWLADSTPVECARSRATVKRSDLAGVAEYGYCASHSRYFWGLRLHLLCTLGGLPVGFALTGAKADERRTLLADPHRRPRAGRASRTDPDRRQELLRPGLRSHPARTGHQPAAPDPQRRTRTTRQPFLQTTAPGHRVDQRHPQRSTRPRSTRRAHPPSPASWPASGSASSLSPPSSGTTTRSAHRSNDH